MKIALCLFGEPRGVDRSFQGIYDNLIDPNNISDVFIHSWFTPSRIGTLWNTTKGTDGSYIVPNLLVEKDTPQKIYDLYRPTACRIDQHLKWSAEKFGRPEYTCYDCIPATQSMACSINRCWNMLEEHEMAIGHRYDTVIFTRPDIILRSQIIIEQLDLNKFTTNHECNHPGGVNYWFGISNRNNMEKYAELYHNMQRVFDTPIKFIPEVVVGTWVNKYCGIELNPILPSYGVLR